MPPHRLPPPPCRMKIYPARNIMVIGVGHTRVLNIIAQDKMDIGTSMESLGSDVVGSFNLNVWFNSNCYTRAVEEYRPGTSGDNKSSALAAGNLIVSGVDVDGADFNITNATTATGRQ